MEAAGIGEMPLGLYYSEKKPEHCFSPAEGPEVSRELEAQGRVDMAMMRQHFSCLMKNVWLARKKGGAACLSKREYGCFGGIFYTGFIDEPIRFIEYYVSTGLEGTPVRGERYMSSPETMRRFLAEAKPPPAPAAYCILKPLPLFTENEQPDHLVAFGRMEALSGLATLATFATGDSEVVAAPFGSGCAHLVAWPRVYAARGIEKAVLGTFDPSARKFMKPDEMFMVFPVSLFDRMLSVMPQSHLGTESWQIVMKKIKKSREIWGEA